MKYIHNKKVQQVSIKEKISRKLSMLLSVLMLSVSLSGFAAAKEITSGGNPATGGTAVCSNVKSLSSRGDARVGETGLASVDINYSVSPCDKTVPIRVEVSLTQNIAGAEPMYLDNDALLSNKVTVFGITVGKSYIAKVKVFNSTTGELLESKQVFAGASRKVGV